MLPRHPVPGYFSRSAPVIPSCLPSLYFHCPPPGRFRSIHNMITIQQNIAKLVKLNFFPLFSFISLSQMKYFTITWLKQAFTCLYLFPWLWMSRERSVWFLCWAQYLWLHLIYLCVQHKRVIDLCPYSPVKFEPCIKLVARRVSVCPVDAQYWEKMIKNAPKL